MEHFWDKPFFRHAYIRKLPSPLKIFLIFFQKRLAIISVRCIISVTNKSVTKRVVDGNVHREPGMVEAWQLNVDEPDF